MRDLCEGLRVVVNTVKGIQILPYNFGKYNLVGGFKKFRKVSCLFLTDIDSSMFEMLLKLWKI